MHCRPKLSPIVALVAAGVLVISCTPRSDPNLAISPRPRAASPAVDPLILERLVESNNQFAIDLFQTVRAGEGNFVVSPFGVSMALAMTLPGMRGPTATELAQTLNIDLEQTQMHAAFNYLEQSLSHADPGPGTGNAPVRFALANALWGERGLTYSAAFLDVLAVNYGAGVHLVDFATETESAEAAVNQWASDQTRGRVRAFLTEGTIRPGTRLLVTANHDFAASWQEPFDPAENAVAPFVQLDGGETQVQMLTGRRVVPYAAGNDYQVIELAYAGGAVVMDLLVPDPGTYQAFELALDGLALQEILAALSVSGVDLSMPRFRVETQLGLAPTLGRLGIHAAFSPDVADLSAVSDSGVNLFLSDVFYRALVSVDDAGSGAAAHGKVTGPRSAPSGSSLRLEIDRPFLFLIRDLATTQILFIGRVLDPTN